MIIKTLDELADLATYLEDKQFIAFDSETTGLTTEDEIIGFSVAAEEDIGYYVILSYWDVQQQKLVSLETKDAAQGFLQGLVGKSLIMQNAPFDCMMVEANFKVNLMPSLHTDTLIAGHLLDENRHNGLKELGVALFGEDARKEQIEMTESVYKNGGVLTREKYELYKADADLIARYGAKDAILTLKIFALLAEQLIEQGLDSFFYDDESMPLLKGPTYDLNTTGLQVDPVKLQTLRNTLEAECMEAKAFIYKEITPHVKEKYKGTGKTNTFNIGSSKQLAWLLFFQLGNEFHTLTKEGKNLCEALQMPIPYAPSAKREFIDTVTRNKGRIYQEAEYNYKTKKMSRPKKVGDPWNYLSCGKETLKRVAPKYKWVDKFLEYAKNLKLLNTYVEGIQSRMRYNVIHPNFLQHGTTSGRYSCRNPNFQNLPRDDKRVKGCIVSRPGKVFVGADYAQLEPRVFASYSKDERLLNCFKVGDDFYSVTGVEVFDRTKCSLKKSDKDSFAVKHPHERDVAKVVTLSATYGTTAFKMAPTIGKSTQEAQYIIDRYFARFPNVYKLMMESHDQVKKTGRVENLFGRPRRIKKAMDIPRLFGHTPHAELPYEYRTLLNLAINHRIQSTGASIMNRAAIACWNKIHALAEADTRWLEVKIVLQVHDQLVLEGPKALAEPMKAVLKDAMENSVHLPGVDLVAEPFVSTDLAGQK